MTETLFRVLFDMAIVILLSRWNMESACKSPS